MTRKDLEGEINSFLIGTRIEDDEGEFTRVYLLERIAEFVILKERQWAMELKQQIPKRSKVELLTYLNNRYKL